MIGWRTTVHIIVQSAGRICNARPVSGPTQREQSTAGITNVGSAAIDVVQSNRQKARRRHSIG